MQHALRRAVRPCSTVTVLVGTLAFTACDRGLAAIDAAVPHATVGADGGSVCLGSVCLDLPPGSASGPVDLSVTPLLALGAGIPAVGPIFDITASTENFDAPITVTFPLPSGVHAPDLAVTFRLADDQPWQSIAARPNADGTGVEVSTLHLSQWALVPRSTVAARIDALAFDAQGRLYTFESAAGRITRVDDASGANPHVLQAIGGTSLAGATGFTLDPTGHLYVVAWQAHRVLRADDIAGTNPTSGDLGEPTFLHARGAIGVDAMSRVFTALSDSYIERTDDLAGTGSTRFSPRCRTVTTPLPFSPDERLAAYVDASCIGFNGVVSIATDSQGRIVATDTQHGRIGRVDDLQGTNWAVYAEPVASPMRYTAVPVGVAVDPHDRIVIAYDRHVVRIDDMTGAGRTVLWEGTDDVTSVTVGPHGELGIGLHGASGATVRVDECPDDPNKDVRGLCGCGVVDDPTDTDGDGVPDCVDPHPMASCECFHLADIVQARAESGAMCELNQPFYMSSVATGAVRIDGTATYLHGVARYRTGTWACFTGCAAGCTPSTSHEVTSDGYDACLDVAKAGCGL